MKCGADGVCNSDFEFLNWFRLAFPLELHIGALKHFEFQVLVKSVAL